MFDCKICKTEDKQLQVVNAICSKNSRDRAYSKLKEAGFGFSLWEVRRHRKDCLAIPKLERSSEPEATLQGDGAVVELGATTGKIYTGMITNPMSSNEEILNYLGIDPTVWAIDEDTVRVNRWQVMAKTARRVALNENGEEVRDYNGRLMYEPEEMEVKWLHSLNANVVSLASIKSTGPAWPLVQPAAPVVIQAPEVSRTPALLSNWKTAVIFPDPQIGYRKKDDDTLDPFHDEAAINVALNILTSVQHDSGVDKVVHLGDFLDLPMFGRFEQEEAFVKTLQPTLDYGHMFLARCHCIAPDAEQGLVEGNHDKRLNIFVTNNALAAFGIKRANMPQEWPVMSLPNLLRLDDLNVKYIDAYPSGRYWINERLQAIHGTRANSNGSTSSQYANAHPHISTVHGHSHRLEMQSKTTFDRAGKLKNMSFSPGCLCRIDGAVPSVNGSVNAKGEPAVVVENWQQGIAVVRYKDDGDFFTDLIQIEDGLSVYGGQEFNSKIVM